MNNSKNYKNLKNIGRIPKIQSRQDNPNVSVSYNDGTKVNVNQINPIRRDTPIRRQYPMMPPTLPPPIGLSRQEADSKRRRTEYNLKSYNKRLNSEYCSFVRTNETIYYKEKSKVGHSVATQTKGERGPYKKREFIIISDDESEWNMTKPMDLGAAIFPNLEYEDSQVELQDPYENQPIGYHPDLNSNMTDWYQEKIDIERMAEEAKAQALYVHPDDPRKRKNQLDEPLDLSTITYNNEYDELFRVTVQDLDDIDSLDEILFG